MTGGGHMVVFDFVGPDPLGIAQVKDCDELAPSGFNFTILHSSPFAGNLGVQRTEGSSFYGDTRPHMVEFLALARAYCHQQKDGVPASFPVKSTKGAVIRHKGTALAGCAGPALKRSPASSCPAVRGCDLRKDGISRGGGAG